MAGTWYDPGADFHTNVENFYRFLRWVESANLSKAEVNLIKKLARSQFNKLLKSLG